MNDFPDLFRSRVRRECQLYLRRRHLSTWDFAGMIAKSRNIPQSERADAPKLGHRSIEGLLSGRKTQLNTLMMIRNFLVEETGLAPNAFDIDPASVATARLWMLQQKSARLDAKVLSAYAGIYTVSGIEDVPYSFRIIVDYEATRKVLLARAVFDEGFTQCMLDGFLIPTEYQFKIEMINRDYGTVYSVTVSHPERQLTVPEVKHGRADWVASLPATVVVPTIEDGFHRDNAYMPGIWAQRDGFVVNYRIFVINKDKRNDIDILRDGMSIKDNRRVYGARPATAMPLSVSGLFET